MNRQDIEKIAENARSGLTLHGPDTILSLCNLALIGLGKVGEFNLRTFSRQNMERCTSPKGFNHPLSGWSLSDWMTATLGELGEAANVVKKLNRVRDGIPGNDKSPDELRQMLADELADAFMYFDIMTQAAGIDLPTAVREKFDRTSAKIGYPPLFAPSPEPEPDLEARALKSAKDEAEYRKGAKP